MAPTVTYLDAQSLRSSKNEATRSYICASRTSSQSQKKKKNHLPRAYLAPFLVCCREKKKSSVDPGGEVAAFWI